MILVVIGAGHSRARDPGAQVHYHHSGGPRIESLRGLVVLPPMLYGTWQCTYVVSGTCHVCVTVYIYSVTERVGGNSLFVALIDCESVAIVTLWRLLTPTVGATSLGLLFILCIRARS